MKVQLNSTCCT